MKLYIFYLNFNINMKPNNTMEDMFICYMGNALMNYSEYIKDSIKIKENKWLYAFTNNKDYAENFEKMHDMDMFIKTTKKITNSEWKLLTNQLEGCLLDNFQFMSSYGVEIDIILTHLENSIMINFEDEFERSMYEYVTMPYSWFKDKYIKALDILMYCTYHQLISSESDFYNYNFSYGITAEGIPRNQVTIKLKGDVAYYELFKYILRKD